MEKMSIIKMETQQTTQGKTLELKVKKQIVQESKGEHYEFV
tara:strand:- start:968 stop:1090 length:123 start_codon:yes stop_codon:yes gene_type:complete